MERVKRIIRKYGGDRIQNLLIWILRKTKLNNRIILFSLQRAKANRVNINYWSEGKNLGDAISPVIVNHMAAVNQIDVDKRVEETRHLYAVGSVITAGCQDCTVWGSGILNARIIPRVKGRKLDVRSVRGPITRMVLMEYGYDVPPIYGDPAIIMPAIYNPDVQKKYPVSVITHMDEEPDAADIDFHRISIKTDDYKAFINEIKASERIISSSLHGIILAEVYGVPAVLLKPQMDHLKYYDFYYGTQRYDFPIAESIAEAMTITPLEIPDYTSMREAVMAAFPVDLWS